MSENPFRNAFACHLATVEGVPVSEEHPTGIKFTIPCACPCYMRVQTRVPVDGQPTLRRDLTVEGCQLNLFPWLQGLLIQQANKASADAEKNSQHVSEALVQIGRVLPMAAEVVRQGMVASALIQIGGGVAALPPGGNGSG